ncbi:hypothetical protein Bbelb_289640, partial [Branchiostoma belcheri]
MREEIIRPSVPSSDPRCLLVGATGTHCRRIAYGRPGARYRAGDQCMHDDLQGPQRRIDDPVSSAVFSAIDRTILTKAVKGSILTMDALLGQRKINLRALTDFSQL